MKDYWIVSVDDVLSPGAVILLMLSMFFMPEKHR